MCGISGLINKSNIQTELLTKEMTKIIAHRGPDKEDYYFHKKLGLGHRRLSIIDLSEDGSQPMHYQNKYTIVYNGEIYNYQEIREELKQQNYTFQTKSDTEVLLTAYDFWGYECLQKFNGMWSFALYDHTKNLLFCSRDRFGIKPFYYYNKQNYFAFASEIKQFTVLPDWEAKLNKQIAYEFLSYSFSDHTEQTFFQEVYQLKGGHYLLYNLSDHQISIQQYYKLNPQKRLQLPFNRAKEKLYEILHSSVRYRMISDVKVGSCLSGGLDSSSIVVEVNKILNESGLTGLQETVSACSEHKKFDESDYINLVVNHTGCINHKVFPQYEKLWSDFEKIVWHQDEPFGSASIFAQWCVFEEANKNNITVMLDGQGSDECLAGYFQFFGNYLVNDFIHLNWTTLLKNRQEIKSLHNLSDLDLLRFSLSSTLTGILYKFGLQFGGKLGDHWLGSKQDITLYPAWKTTNNCIENESLEQIIRTKLPVLLHNEDRNSMAFSIESRVPFLDYRFVELALSLSPNYKINKGQTKYILREMMKTSLPEEITNRQDKMAFVTPEEIWIKENQEEILNELIDLVKNSNGFVNFQLPEYFRQIMNDQKKFDSTIFRFLAFSKWLKVFNVEINNS